MSGLQQSSNSKSTSTSNSKSNKMNSTSMNSPVVTPDENIIPRPSKMARAVSVMCDKNVPPFDEKSDTIKHHRVVDEYNLTNTIPMVNLLDPERKPLDSTIILDETGSMEMMGKEPMDAVNAYIKEQKESGLDVSLTLIKFNSLINVVYEDKPISSDDVNIKNYNPNNMTALNDAIRYAILTAKTPRAVIIVTDGEDNLSITTQVEINTLIERATALGWVFTFIGCNYEAMQQASMMPPSMHRYTSNESQGAPSLLHTMRGISGGICRYNAMANTGATQDELNEALTQPLF